MTRLIQCNEASHSQAILAIFNDAIANSTALYDYQPRTQQTMANWFAAKRVGGFPVVGFENQAGVLMGFGSYGPFRPFPANKYSIEHSVYVHADFRGQGIGALLLEAVIQEAQQHNFHMMVGGIDSSNHASIALHQRFGFVHAGTIKEAGFKFGRWLDLAFYQKILATPDVPIDG